METEMKDLAESIYGLIGALTALIVCPIFSGYVASILWAWFVVPTFGLSPISIPSAMGVVLLVSFMTKSADPKALFEKNEHPHRDMLMAFIKPLSTLFFGWVINHWM